MSETEEDRPFPEAELSRIRRVRPNPRAVRRKLKMSQSEFARAFGFNLATLRDWEQGRSAPDQAVRSFLTVIVNDPDGVRKILEPV